MISHSLLSNSRNNIKGYCLQVIGSISYGLDQVRMEQAMVDIWRTSLMYMGYVSRTLVIHEGRYNRRGSLAFHIRNPIFSRLMILKSLFKVISLLYSFLLSQILKTHLFNQLCFFNTVQFQVFSLIAYSNLFSSNLISRVCALYFELNLNLCVHPYLSFKFLNLYFVKYYNRFFFFKKNVEHYCGNYMRSIAETCKSF